MSDAVEKVVLAYSAGLDTSVILRWLQETYRCEVVTFTAELGAREIFVDDLREEFVRDAVGRRLAIALSAE
jgi:argininosuccinate synthase